MTNLQQVALKKLVNVLQGMNAKYKIVLADGTEMGNLKQTHKTRSFKYPFGALTQHFLPFVKDLQPGHAVTIPAGEYDPEAIRTSFSAWGNKNWGTGNSTSTISRKNRTVEILRLA